jgi:hypothetical protein
MNDLWKLLKQLRKLHWRAKEHKKAESMAMSKTQWLSALRLCVWLFDN